MTAPAWATLGGSAASVTTDSAQLKAQAKTLTTPETQGQAGGYTVMQLTDNAGDEVREFISPSGVVFGIAWQGRFPPDLKQLLGNYFSTLQTKQQQQQPSPAHGHAPFMMRTANLVLTIGGHMGMHTGVAYDPTLIPANVSPTVIR